MSLPANMKETWGWHDQFGAYFYTITVEGSPWKYERLIEDNPATLPPEIMSFYHDDAAEAFQREHGVFRKYRRKQIAELARWFPGMDMTGVSISAEDARNGSPKAGDMVARNPKNHADTWLVAAQYFADNFEEIA